MSKIKPQIKKNNPNKSNFSNGWRIFGAMCMIGEMAFTLLGGAKNKKKITMSGSKI
ncbi:hypothetical protein [Helicobacter pylori]|uniref:hypothetical protein n=1 Tax=Helicobacter pylori TaxID=210 RepID=UPI0013CDFC1C|nr:hypothetical protein [Helicobacter pylori]